ncbi:hypothetical protein GF385_00190 [Candidatus Dependentiae bacterium]|nr:hypothetical protein [Candidatus Dependentiae bacterium]
MGKKDKNIKKIKLVIIFFATLSLLFFLIVPLSKRVFFCISDKTLKFLRPDNIVLSLDNIYSDKLKNKITAFVLSYFKEHTIDKLNLLDFDFELKNKFNLIKKIEWDFSLPGSAKLKLIGKEPVCFLNKKYILTDHKDLFKTKYFKNFKIDISKDFYTSKRKISDNLFKFLNKIPDNIWRDYELSYKNKFNIKLIPKLNKIPVYKRLLSTRNNFCNENKLLKANMLFEHLYNNNKLFLSKKYLLDLRFDKKIILRRENEINRGMG